MIKRIIITAKIALATFLILETGCVNPSGQKDDDTTSEIDTTLYNPNDIVNFEETTSALESEQKGKDAKNEMDESYDTDKSIVGTWCNVRGGEIYKFKSNHTGVFSTEYTSSKFKWKKSGNEIRINHNDGGKTVLKIRNGKLEEWSDLFGTTFIFKKMTE